MEAIAVENAKREDIAVQCDLLVETNGQCVHEFDIKDLSLRRGLVRRCYGILIIQIGCVIPSVEFLLAFQFPHEKIVEAGTLMFNLAAYTILYIFRDWRRVAPYNYLVLLLTTATSVLFRSVHIVQLSRSRWVYIYPLALILELFVLALYTKQQRLKITNSCGLALISGTFGLLLLGAYVFNMFFELLTGIGCVFEAWYIIHDTHLMLTSHHGYNIQAHEYIFAACNIHADLAKFVWLLFKETILISQDTSIQCDLLSDGQRPYLPGFDITNASTRRKLVRRCYALLIVSNLIFNE
ncbi:uncharacterized protein LOC115634366 [Scaptodrosophila lebanonensis]|uniref:Uncharacterized protein LOC115634366 n=1 Tax=Drosophila lebanonensis TaxID=7225 RepID=A0A6J2UK78_DROLE|nr:uncharacterized protein LOC115634366 [Scaptodrosophila lebanonensis]